VCAAPLPAGTRTEAKAHAAYVEICHEGKCVARHERCFSRQQKILDLEHYLDVLAKGMEFGGVSTRGRK
jgi:hypothetical protein